MDLIYRTHVLIFKLLKLDAHSTLSRISNYVFSKIINIVYSIQYRFIIGFGLLDNSNPSYPNIRISVTTFPARINRIVPVLVSLLSQKKLNVKIDLYLALEEFNNGKTDIPPSILRFEDLGLNIVFVKKNFMPHNKYYYACLNTETGVVFTADDDVIYPSDLYIRIYNEYLKYSGCLIVSRAHKIKHNDGGFLKYSTWDYDYSGNESSFYFHPTGVGGLAIPVNSYGKELLNHEVFMKLSPKADDLWLHAMSILYKVKVKICEKNYVVLFNVKGSQTRSLANYNVAEDGNDVQLDNLNRHYNLISKLRALDEERLTL